MESREAAVHGQAGCRREAASVPRLAGTARRTHRSTPGDGSATHAPRPGRAAIVRWTTEGQPVVTPSPDYVVSRSAVVSLY